MSGKRIESKLAGIKKKLSATGESRLFKWFLEFVQTLFVVLLTTYLLLILLETVFEGSVSTYINLNYMLIGVIAIGIVAVLAGPKTVKRVKEERLTAKTFLMIICAGAGGAVIVWYKTRETGWLSIVISLVSGALIVLLSLLIWNGEEEDKEPGRTDPVETGERDEKTEEPGGTSAGVDQAAKEVNHADAGQGEGEANEKDNSQDH